MNARVQKTKVEKPRLKRMVLLRSVMIGFKAVLDEELQPLGITTAQLRVLWGVEVNSAVSGAEIARYCELTPQSAQAVLALLERSGWIVRRHSATNDRVLVAEVTTSGRTVLKHAKALAEKLDRKMWKGIGEQELAGMEAALTAAAERLKQ